MLNVWFYLFVLFVGVMLSMLVMVWVCWIELYWGLLKLYMVFFFELVMDEVCYIIGLVLVVSFSVGWFVEVGLLLVMLFLVVGVSLFSL